MSPLATKITDNGRTVIHWLPILPAKQVYHNILIKSRNFLELV